MTVALGVHEGETKAEGQAEGSICFSPFVYAL